MANVDDLPMIIESRIREINKTISLGMRSRAYRASNELRNASQEVLRGQRSGRVYKIPGTHGKRLSKATKSMLDDYGHKFHGGVLYRASAPGEPPAVRLGHFRQSWQTKTQVHLGTDNMVSVRPYIVSRIKTDNGRYNLGKILEEGTSRMAPRPYKERIQKKALPRVKRIYQEPYF